MPVPLKLRTAVIALVLFALVPSHGTLASARQPGAAKIKSVMSTLISEHDYRAHIFGVWRGGQRVVSGAAGSSQDGVRARTDMHFRAGNTGGSMVAVALYRLAEQGRVSLDDPLSRWYPDLPNADQVTLGMLANMVTGYNDFVTTESFVEQFYANPFRIWFVPELLDLAFSEPPLFDPGTSWKFSDTNYVILGDVIRRVTGSSPERVVGQLVLDPLRLRDTQMSPIARLPSPALHSYTSERGVYEDTTFWSTSWVRGAADGYSTVSDLARWARARARGRLLSPASQRALFAPDTAGLGPWTADRYYANGASVDSGWIFNNPAISGYTVVVAHHLPTDTTVTVVTTPKPTTDQSIRYAVIAFQRLAQLLTPASIPQLNPCPRGGC